LFAPIIPYEPKREVDHDFPHTKLCVTIELSVTIFEGQMNTPFFKVTYFPILHSSDTIFSPSRVVFSSINTFLHKIESEILHSFLIFVFSHIIESLISTPSSISTLSPIKELKILEFPIFTLLPKTTVPRRFLIFFILQSSAIQISDPILEALSPSISIST